MKKGLVLVFILLANPAFAHHKVIVATPMIRLVSDFVALPNAGLAAWCKRRGKP